MSSLAFTACTFDFNKVAYIFYFYLVIMGYEVYSHNKGSRAVVVRDGCKES